MTSSDDSGCASSKDHREKNEDCAIQLIRAIGDNEKPKLRLNKQNLQKILNSAEGRPLIVISVVGPPCTGKSTLINFILRGIEAMENGSRTSLGDNGDPLVGFASAFRKKSPCTKGVWAWSRPFLVDHEHKKIAVILLDTQGLDETWVAQAVLGLAFLSSSLLIYNTESNVPDNIFEDLSPYLKFGLRCCDTENQLLEEETQFQKICFLFRDWNQPENFSFGFRGGKRYLDEQISGLNRGIKRVVRAGIKCFEQVSGFLIAPNATETSIKPPTGSETDQAFETHLETFIRSILKTENLFTKRVLGVELSPGEFGYFLEDYVSMFNSIGEDDDAVVSEEDIWESTCKTLHENIVKSAFAKYERTFNRKFKRTNDKSPESLHAIHESACKDANLIFENAKKISEFERQYKRKLRTKMKNAFENLEPVGLDTADLYEVAENFTKVELKTYKRSLLKKADKDGVYTSSALSKLHDGQVWEILNRFDDMCPLSEGSPQREVLKKQLQKSLENIYEKEVYIEWVRMQVEGDDLSTESETEEQNQNIELMQQQAENWIAEKLKAYEETMSLLTNSCNDSEEFRKSHVETMENILGSFENDWKDENPDVCEEYKNMLVEKLESVFAELQDILGMQLQGERSAVEGIKEHARKEYHEEMEKELQKQEWFELKDLLILHNCTVDSVIKGCDEAQRLEDAHKKLLQDYLNISFIKYKEKNEMLLNSKNEPAIGIDLGTTHCCVAVFVKDKVSIVRNLQGHLTTPSYVRISKDGSTLVGPFAKANSYKDPETTVFDAKRLIGRRFDDKHVQNDIKFWPFKVVEKKTAPVIEVWGKEYLPEQISSIILKQLKEDAENFVKRKVKKAVITIPAYFTDGQRQATVDAGELAGLEVLTIINEPTAAAIAYKLERFHEDSKYVLVFDLGGGTFDVALLKADASSIEILCVDGDSHLGGEDFDKALMEYCAKKFKSKEKIDLFKDKDTDDSKKVCINKQRLRRLQTSCESAKQELSHGPTTTITIDNFADQKDLVVTISRAKFEHLIAPLLKKTITIVEQTLCQAQLSKDDIGDIVLVGGSTRIPKVKEMLSTCFNERALNHEIHPDEAVAYGAAIQAALLNGNTDTKLSQFSSIQDVTPMSLGIEVYKDGKSGQYSPIVPKSTRIPAVKIAKYATLKDNQNTFLISIYQGEHKTVKKNEFLGHFIVKDVPNGAAGEQTVVVRMEVNKMGILHVTAVCLSSTGSKVQLDVDEDKGRLSSEDKIQWLKNNNDDGAMVEQPETNIDLDVNGMDVKIDGTKKPKRTKKLLFFRTNSKN